VAVEIFFCGNETYMTVFFKSETHVCI